MIWQMDLTRRALSNPLGFFRVLLGSRRAKFYIFLDMSAQDPDGNTVGVGDIRAQTRQTLINIQTVLSSVGGEMSDIAKVTVFITDMSTLADIHAVRAEFFDPPYPASTLVEVSQLVNPEWLIEIEAVAVIPFDRVKNPA